MIAYKRKRQKMKRHSDTMAMRFLSFAAYDNCLAATNLFMR
jgi:hypothetical protein